MHHRHIIINITMCSSGGCCSLIKKEKQHFEFFDIQVIRDTCIHYNFFIVYASRLQNNVLSTIPLKKVPTYINSLCLSLYYILYYQLRFHSCIFILDDTDFDLTAFMMMPLTSASIYCKKAT